MTSVVFCERTVFNVRFTGVRYAELLYRNTKYVYDSLECSPVKDMMGCGLRDLFYASLGDENTTYQMCQFLANMQFDIEFLYIRRQVKQKAAISYELVDMSDVTKSLFITVNVNGTVHLDFHLFFPAYVSA